MRRALLLFALLPALALGQTSVQVITSDTIQSGCVLNALNATCVVPMRGKSSAGFVITATSSPTGITLVGEVTKDGTNWGQRPLVNSSNETRYYAVPNAQLAVGLSRTVTMGGGARFVRVRASTWTSGSVTVAMVATDSADSVLEPTLGNALKPTYLACSGALANTAASTSIVCESGASKQTRIRAVYVLNPGSQTTAALRTLVLQRTTTASSSGTAITPAPVDTSVASGDSAFSGVCRTKPTAGSAGTTFATVGMWVPTAVANTAPISLWPPPVAWNGTTVKDLTIPVGTTNGISVTDTGATGGANLYICMLLTEE